MTDLVLHPVDGTFEVPGAFKTAQLPGDIVIDTLGVNFIEIEEGGRGARPFLPQRHQR